MQYVYFKYRTKRGFRVVCADSIEFERIGIDKHIIEKLGTNDWQDFESWAKTGIDINEDTVFCNVFPLSGEPCFAIVRLYSEDGCEIMRLVINDEAEILTESGHLLERVI